MGVGGGGELWGCRWVGLSWVDGGEFYSVEGIGILGLRGGG